MKDYEQQSLPFDFLETDRNSGRTRSEPPFFDLPRNDNERLLNCQWAARHGDGNALGEMYRLGRRVALKYINRQAKNNRHVSALSRDEKDEKAHNAITYIVERLLRSGDFCIRKSFTAYLYLRVQHELFYRRKVDEIVRFVDMEDMERLMD